MALWVEEAIAAVSMLVFAASVLILSIAAEALLT
jgi:hypothetical protein